ncbi:MAG: rod shape-determining protein MreD [Planctomycetes bacterium]|nr:rod shape-determining protein MreD [Planctomycetota bacterium]
MNWSRFSVALIIVTLLQASFVDAISIAGIKPNLLLVVLVFFAIYANPTEAIITSFIIGFAADVALGTTIGPHIIGFGLFGTLLSNLNRVIAIRQVQYQCLAIFATGFFSGLAVWLLTAIRRQPLGHNVTAILLQMPLYSSLVGPILFIPYAWWMNVNLHRFSRQQS